MKMNVDARELQALGRDLEGSGRRISKKVEPVVFKGAMNVKKQMQTDLKASKHFKGIQPAVDFDIHTNPYGVLAEIGPRKGSPGSLANIAYFGTSRGGGTVDVENGLKQESPRFEKALRDVIGDV